jgi:diguanylate cyclase (GGDEF)-like protein
MRKRFLIFLSFVIVAAIVWVQSKELLLSFYVLFPALLFPFFFFMEDYDPILVPATLFMVLIIYLIYLIRVPSFDILFLGLGYVLTAAAFLFYRRQWKLAFLKEADQCEISLRELDTLKQKHHSRLESLHHLEKQVAGLLDLFEIARDFNDYLNFQGMANILYERVRPELPFKELRLILLEKDHELNDVNRIFTITPDGVHESSGEEDLTDHEKEMLPKVQGTRKLLQNPEELIFPIITDNEMTACLIARGTQPDDLAKFEVLAAYMALQVKKVRLYETVRELSIRDGLTGVFVRRYFMQRLDEEIKRSNKYSLSMAVLMLDIDLFKRYNDDYGHLAGDATLKQVAALLKENLRKVDIVGRYGGEEFVVVIPETGRAQALEIAERIRSNIARHNFKVYNDHTRVTVSIGISLFPDDIPNWQTHATPSELPFELIRQADKALYRAKEEGRNRVVLFTDIQS